MSNHPRFNRRSLFRRAAAGSATVAAIAAFGEPTVEAQPTPLPPVDPDYWMVESNPLAGATVSFGDLGDGDVSAFLQAGLDIAAKVAIETGHATVQLGPHIYRTRAPLVVRSRVHFTGGGSKIALSGPSEWAIEVAEDAHDVCITNQCIDHGGIEMR